MRRRWVDVYRGSAILFMLILHFFVNIFPNRPLSFLEYSHGGVISIGDMDIAMFLFISGVSIYLSLSKRRNSDDAIRHVAFHYTKIFLLGLLLDSILIATTGRIWWVLEAISLSALLSMFFLCSDRMRIIAIIVIGICYSYFLSVPYVLEAAYLLPNGGILGSISLSGIVMVGYMCAEHLMRKKQPLQASLYMGALLVLLGLLLSIFIGYDRSIGTFPYILLSSGFCILLTLAIYWAVELNGITSKLLEDLGRITLLVFTLNYPILIAALMLHLENSFSTPVAALITLVLIALIAIISKIYLKFKKL